MEEKEAVLLGYEALKFISESGRLNEEFLDHCDEEVGIAEALNVLEELLEADKIWNWIKRR